MQDTSRWYRSFYWRIGVGFVVFVIAVIVAQSVMFSFLMSRSNAALQGPSPNSFATVVEGDLGSALAADPMLNLHAHLVRGYGGSQFHVCAVMADQRVACNSERPLADIARRTALAALASIDYRQAGGDPRISGPPIVMAPIQVRKELVGMVVVPPMTQHSAILRDVGTNSRWTMSPCPSPIMKS